MPPLMEMRVLDRVADLPLGASAILSGSVCWPRSTTRSVVGQRDAHVVSAVTLSGEVREVWLALVVGALHGALSQGVGGGREPGGSDGGPRHFRYSKLV